MSSLEKALRDAGNLGKLNLFRNRARGGWDAAAARIGTETSFVVGFDEDPAAALLKALRALAASSGSAAPAPAVPAAAEPRTAPSIPGPADASRYKGGIFG